MGFLDHLTYEVIYQHEANRDISLEERESRDRETSRERHREREKMWDECSLSLASLLAITCHVDHKLKGKH